MGFAGGENSHHNGVVSQLNVSSPFLASSGVIKKHFLTETHCAYANRQHDHGRYSDCAHTILCLYVVLNTKKDNGNKLVERHLLETTRQETKTNETTTW